MSDSVGKSSPIYVRKLTDRYNSIRFHGLQRNAVNSASLLDGNCYVNAMCARAAGERDIAVSGRLTIDLHRYSF